LCDALGLGYGPCQGDVTPQPDNCNDLLDNDCNGVANDGFLTGAAGCVCFPQGVSTCYTGPSGTSGIGVCKSGMATCNLQGTGFGACNGQVVPSTDHCTDSLDNDCNGVVNDGAGKGGQGCVCTPYAQQDCYTGPPGTLNVGLCKSGKSTCAATGTSWGACIGQVIPDLDSCLDTYDNDCNGIVNDGNHLAPGCACTPGQIKCEGNSRRICDAVGDWGPAQSCGAQICLTGIGCAVCVPGTATCVGNVAHTCLGDGSGYVDYVCDPLMGSACTNGTCTGPCSPQALGKSYIGCDYYPTVTTNSQLTNLSSHFAVAVSNTTANQATITVTQDATTVVTQAVAANSVAVIMLPWTALRTATASTLVANGAYRLRSTQPVTVYQFNPLEYSAGGTFTYTNDASLLLPVTAWNLQYVVASRNNWLWSGYNLPGFYAVVASEASTTVTLTPSPTGGSVRAGGGVPLSGAATVTLGAGSVLQVLSYGAENYDLTGTRITANKPVQVISGHDCTFIPATVGYCDHIEEAMFPVATLSTDYISSAPSLPSLTTPKAAFTRIIATEATTSLTYDPAGVGPASIAAAGGYVEIDNAAAFRIIANKKILVSQYMKGQDAGGGSGDPAMALAVPTAQFRSDYLFHAPTNYQTNYVNVVAPSAATVLLDNVAVSNWVNIGATGLRVARVQLSNAGNGNHRLTSSQPAGITVYGYGQYTSFWYPGGLNLSDL
jgi:hypothetical protein